MQSLLRLLFQKGGFVTLVLVEALCFYCIVTFNTKQGLVWETTYGIAAGNLLEQRRQVMQYRQFPHLVDSLAWHNSSLVAELLNRKSYSHYSYDTVFLRPIDSLPPSRKQPNYSVIPAQIVTNTVNKRNNWIALNRGAADGVVKNSAVLTDKGVLGVVRYVDQHYCLAMSILHQQCRVSAKLDGQLGSLMWTETKDYTVMQLNDIPKDIEPEVGDTVYTSGYSSMFPPGHMVGRVVSKVLPQGSNFYSIDVKLSQNPGSADNVFIVNKLFAPVLDSLLNKAEQSQ
jgi:rod shape-determining protein MreC